MVAMLKPIMTEGELFGPNYKVCCPVSLTPFLMLIKNLMPPDFVLPLLDRDSIRQAF